MHTVAVQSAKKEVYVSWCADRGADVTLTHDLPPYHERRTTLFIQQTYQDNTKIIIVQSAARLIIDVNNENSFNCMGNREVKVGRLMCGSMYKDMVPGLRQAAFV